ncbi:YkgJ family cysteine cluster protein [Tautonia sociabilis]|uniref:YkgJ family cysteine cluster protein n=1 Tax=Tautonia sociabilis TaxID=2080755 RepID=A0A432MN43_9BACT|nr:YkgJ family cysteine cluster protein [Tautonia sociabilis]RUL88526.1 hypothetical protein TsocGM_06280 [Tautonia sociabilis]
MPPPSRPSPRRQEPPAARRRRPGAGPSPGGRQDPWSLEALVRSLRDRVRSYAASHPDEPPSLWLYREIDSWAADRDDDWKRRRSSRAVLPLAPEPSCRPGCVHCCYQHVAVTPAEARLLADHLARLRPNAEVEVEALLARLSRAAEDCRRLIAEAPDPRASRLALARVRRPCPLLDERLGRCLAYDARPVNCRRENSLDVEVCRRYRDDPDCPDSSLRLVRYDVIWGAAFAFLARWGPALLLLKPGAIEPLDVALSRTMTPGSPIGAEDAGGADHPAEP